MLSKLFMVLAFLLCLPQVSLAKEEYWEQGLSIPSKTIKLPAGVPSVFDKDTKGSGVDTQSLKLAATGADDLVVIVQTPSSNQPIKIYQLQGKVYRLILDGVAQVWYPIAELVKGRHSIVLQVHDSAAESEFLVYQFNGKKYSLAKKFNVVYSDEKHRTIKSVPVKK